MPIDLRRFGVSGGPMADARRLEGVGERPSSMGVEGRDVDEADMRDGGRRGCDDVGNLRCAATIGESSPFGASDTRRLRTLDVGRGIDEPNAVTVRRSVRAARIRSFRSRKSVTVDLAVRATAGDGILDGDGRPSGVLTARRAADACTSASLRGVVSSAATELAGVDGRLSGSWSPAPGGVMGRAIGGGADDRWTRSTASSSVVSRSSSLSRCVSSSSIALTTSSCSSIAVRSIARP